MTIMPEFDWSCQNYLIIFTIGVGKGCNNWRVLLYLRKMKGEKYAKIQS